MLGNKGGEIRMKNAHTHTAFWKKKHGKKKPKANEKVACITGVGWKGEKSRGNEEAVAHLFKLVWPLSHDNVINIQSKIK